MKDAMMVVNALVACVSGVIAFWKSVEVVSWIAGTGDLANPESSVGVLLVCLVVLAFALLNVTAIYEGWPCE